MSTCFPGMSHTGWQEGEFGGRFLAFCHMGRDQVTRALGGNGLFWHHLGGRGGRGRATNFGRVMKSDIAASPRHHLGTFFVGRQGHRQHTHTQSLVRRGELVQDVFKGLLRLSCRYIVLIHIDVSLVGASSAPGSTCKEERGLDGMDHGCS